MIGRAEDRGGRPHLGRGGPDGQRSTVWVDAVEGSQCAFDMIREMHERWKDLPPIDSGPLFEGAKHAPHLKRATRSIPDRRAAALPEEPTRSVNKIYFVKLCAHSVKLCDRWLSCLLIPTARKTDTYPPKD